MAQNQDGAEKTEQATGKKLDEARDKGQVAKSVDITTSAALLFGTSLVFILGNKTVGGIHDLMRRVFMHSHEYIITQDSVQSYSVSFLILLAGIIFPISLGIAAIILTAEISQVGLKFSSKKFTEGLNLKAIFNPFSGLKKIFASGRSLFELLKSFLKLGMVGVLVYNVLSKYSQETVILIEKPISDIGLFISKVSFELITKVGILFILIAGGDYFYQKYRFKEDMKMTKQEVKEEAKQMEGDMKMKQKIRSIMRGRLRKMMLANVKKADVVITNPTHFAIALKYDKNNHSAPVVLAKGLDFLALKIREIAVENNVPIVEEPPLARALYYTVEIEQEIPENLFKAVAQVLAYIYNLKHKNKNG